MEIVIAVIVAVVALIIGVAAGFVISNNNAQGKAQLAKTQAEERLANASKEAENLKREALIEADSEALRIKKEAEAENKERMREVRSAENRLQQRESSLDKRVEALDTREHQLSTLNGQLERRARDLSAAEEEASARLEHIAGLTTEEAKQELLDSLRDDVVHESAAIIRDAEMRTKAECDKRSREILSLAIQRVAADHSAENTVSSIHIPSDELKGRIIGRE